MNANTMTLVVKVQGLTEVRTPSNKAVNRGMVLASIS